MQVLNHLASTFPLLDTCFFPSSTLHTFFSTQHSHFLLHSRHPRGGGDLRRHQPGGKREDHMRRLSIARVQALRRRLPIIHGPLSRDLLVQLGNLVLKGPMPHTQQLAVGYVSGFSTAANEVSRQENDQRVFVGHVFYKGKSALSMKPKGPEFKQLEGGSLALKREGCMFLEFAPAIAQRQYDWKRKHLFALSIGELGTLIGLLPNEGCEFYHDPNMGKSDAGKVRKTLKVDPMPDKSGHFFNLSVVDKSEKIDDRYVLALSRPEFTVMKSAMNFIIPYLMGWHIFIDPNQLGNNLLTGRRKPQGSVLEGNPNLEWEK